jgi:nucleotide-binding universal stress UspA family protein
VGRTGESRMRAKFFGSVPGQLIQMADVPVTVVP